MSGAFLVTTLIVVATPGIGVLYTLSAGLSRGARSSVAAAVGCTLGIVAHMAATVTGLAALLHTSALAFQVVKYLGVGYLLYVAWATLTLFFVAFLPQFVSPGEPNSLVRDAGVECGLHARHVRGLRRRAAQPRNLAATGAELDAPGLCGLLRRARRQARIR